MTDHLAVADAALAIVQDQQASKGAGIHYDLYSVRTDPDTMEMAPEPEPRRLDSPGIQAVAWGLPYFNGYTITTKGHRDGECEAHRPTLRVRRLAR